MLPDSAMQTKGAPGPLDPVLPLDVGNGVGRVTQSISQHQKMCCLLQILLLFFVFCIFFCGFFGPIFTTSCSLCVQREKPV